MSKCLGGIIGCKYKTSSWHLNGFPCGSITLGQQYKSNTFVVVDSYYFQRFFCPWQLDDFFFLQPQEVFIGGGGIIIFYYY